MTIYTLKFSRKKVVAAILIIAIIIAAIIIVTPDKKTDQSQAPNQPNASAASVKGIKSNEDCVSYINSLGYECAGNPADTRKVTIPKEFDDVYTKYNEIQLDCGFNLQDYRGKGVTLYTYYVTNYEGYSDVLLDLLVYKDKIIGGAVYTASIDGFMHGLVNNPSV